VGGSAQFGGGQLVSLAKKGIESAQAGKSTGIGHLDHREIRIRQEALSQKKPLSLRDLNRGHAEDTSQNPAEMAIGHSERSCEPIYPGFSQ
jgi:hypothetical protein